MNEQVEQTTKTREYGTITFAQTVNTGNYENRRYVIEMQANGATFHEVMDLLERDILEREAMYEKVETLGKKIDRLERKIESLKRYIINARTEFVNLDKLLISESPDDEQLEKREMSWEHLKNMMTGAAGRFDELFELLEIKDDPDSEGDDIPW